MIATWDYTYKGGHDRLADKGDFEKGGKGFRLNEKHVITYRRNL